MGARERRGLRGYGSLEPSGNVRKAGSIMGSPRFLKLFLLAAVLAVVAWGGLRWARQNPGVTLKRPPTAPVYQPPAPPDPYAP